MNKTENNKINKGTVASLKTLEAVKENKLKLQYFVHTYV